MTRRAIVAVALLGAFTACSSNDRTADAPAGSTGTVAAAPPATADGTIAPGATATAPDPSPAPGTDAPVTTSTTTVRPTGTLTTVDGPQGRPFELYVPAGYRDDVAVPLVVVLHGYTASAVLQELYFGVRPLADEYGFISVHPDGTPDARGNRFWNATDACCDFGAIGVDDAAYLASVIEQVRASYRVDAQRIYLFGHSNGGFMSFRMACDHPGTIAAIASLAGAGLTDPASCAGSAPVSVLQIHGTDDNVIEYDGGELVGDPYPGAIDTVTAWAAVNGCSGVLAPATDDAGAVRLDLEADLPGADTDVERVGGCPDGGAVELWTIRDGGHVPELSSTFTAEVVEFLLAHPKP